MLAIESCRTFVHKEANLSITEKISLEECEELWRAARTLDPRADGLVRYVEAALEIKAEDAADFLDEALTTEALCYVGEEVGEDIQNNDKTTLVNLVALILKERESRRVH